MYEFLKCNVVSTIYIYCKKKNITKLRIVNQSATKISLRNVQWYTYIALLYTVWWSFRSYSPSVGGNRHENNWLDSRWGNVKELCMSEDNRFSMNGCTAIYGDRCRSWPASSCFILFYSCIKEDSHSQIESWNYKLFDMHE